MIRKRKNLAVALFLAVVGAGYAREALPLVHTETLSLAGIESLSISYGSDDLVLRESESDNLVIKEYMNRDNSRYYARLSGGAGTVQLKQGKRPWLWRWGWEARAEIYLPRSFQGNLRIFHSSGNLSGDTELLGYKTIDIQVGSGTVLLKKISGETVSIHVSSGELDTRGIAGNSFIRVSSGRLQSDGLTGGEHRIKISSGRARIGDIEGRSVIEVSSGNMVLDRVRGALAADISSGSLTLEDFSGQGTVEMSSGNLSLGLKELRGDLHLQASSGSIKVTIPAAVPFNLDALTKSGKVQVYQSGNDALAVSGNSTVLRPFGPSPEHTIFARLSSGNISIHRE
jgi:hypothetical protein